MSGEIRPVSMLIGVLYMLFGGAFLAEAFGLWEFELDDLAVLGPLALILLGLALVVPGLMRTGASRPR